MFNRIYIFKKIPDGTKPLDAPLPTWPRLRSTEIYRGALLLELQIMKMCHNAWPLEDLSEVFNE